MAKDSLYSAEPVFVALGEPVARRKVNGAAMSFYDPIIVERVFASFKSMANSENDWKDDCGGDQCEREISCDPVMQTGPCRHDRQTADKQAFGINDFSNCQHIAHETQPFSY